MRKGIHKQGTGIRAIENNGYNTFTKKNLIEITVSGSIKFETMIFGSDVRSSADGFPVGFQRGLCVWCWQEKEN